MYGKKLQPFTTTLVNNGFYSNVSNSTQWKKSAGVKKKKKKDISNADFQGELFPVGRIS